MRGRSLSLLSLPIAVALASTAGLAGGPAVVTAAAQDPSPAPSIVLRAADAADDGTFHLEIRVDDTRFADDGPPIAVDTVLAYVGDQPQVTVTHAGGGIVAFGVRQLDGPFQPGGPGRRMSRHEDTWHAGEHRGIPFAKSGGFAADDPLADMYRDWFADPMLRLGPGTYQIMAQAEYRAPGQPADRVLEASVVVEVAPGPSARPFTAPLVPRPPEDPDLPDWAPDGPPAATVTERGLRLELWLSTTTLAPGEWVQAAVRATNTGDDPVWQYAGECATYRSYLRASAIRRDHGASHTGDAAAFKRRAMRVGRPDPTLWGQSLDPPGGWLDLEGVRVVASAECAGTVDPPLVRLRPGESRWERFAGYAGAPVDHGPRFTEPLSPGSSTLTAEWPFAGRGDRPRVAWGGSRPDPIAVSTPITLTGGGPTSAPLGTLVDAALADPRFAAWVDANPAGVGWEVYVSRWPGPAYPNPRWATIRDRAPYGMTELTLAHSGHMVHALLDTWTGELLDVVFE